MPIIKNHWMAQRVSLSVHRRLVGKCLEQLFVEVKSLMKIRKDFLPFFFRFTFVQNRGLC